MDQWEIEFLKAMKGLSLLYGKTMIPELLEIYRMVLKPLSVEEFILAISRWVEDPSHVFFPLPAQLKAMVDTPISEGEASLIAERIWTSLSRYGTDRHGTERAQDFINSEFGWAIVENSGGWESISRSVRSLDDGPILKAQWRKSIFELMAKYRRGEKIHTESHRRVGGPSNQGLTQIGQAFNKEN